MLLLSQPGRRRPNLQQHTSQWQCLATRPGVRSPAGSTAFLTHQSRVRVRLPFAACVACRCRVSRPWDGGPSGQKRQSTVLHSSPDARPPLGPLAHPRFCIQASMLLLEQCLTGAGPCLEAHVRASCPFTNALGFFCDTPLPTLTTQLRRSAPLRHRRSRAASVHHSSGEQPPRQRLPQ